MATFKSIDEITHEMCETARGRRKADTGISPDETEAWAEEIRSSFSIWTNDICRFWQDRESKLTGCISALSTTNNVNKLRVSAASDMQKALSECIGILDKLAKCGNIADENLVREADTVKRAANDALDKLNEIETAIYEWQKKEWGIRTMEERRKERTPWVAML